MQIRFATPPDLTICRAVDQALGFKSSSTLVEAQETGHLIIAEDEEQPVAYLWMCLLWGDTPFVNLVRVMSDRQREGVGTALYQFLEENLRKEGHDLLVSSSQETNDGGRVFHEKLGFRECGVWELEGRDKELFFEKKL